MSRHENNRHRGYKSNRFTWLYERSVSQFNFSGVYTSFIALQLLLKCNVGSAWMKAVRWMCQAKRLWWVKTTLSYTGPFSCCSAKEIRYLVSTTPSSSSLHSFMGIFLAVSKWRRVTYVLQSQWRAVGCGMFLHNSFVHVPPDVTYVYVSKTVFVKMKNDWCFVLQITYDLERLAYYLLLHVHLLNDILHSYEK